MGTVLLCFALALSGPPSYFAPRVHCGMDCSRPSAPSLLAYLLTLLSLPYSSILVSHTILSYTTPTHPNPDGAPLTSGGKDEQASLLAADGTANETKAAGNEKAAAAGAGVTPSGEAAGAAADNGWFADPPNIKRHDQGRGLCDYYSECGTCCMGTFCPCVTFGQQAEYTGMGSCCLCGCLYLGEDASHPRSFFSRSLLSPPSPAWPSRPP